MATQEDRTAALQRDYATDFDHEDPEFNERFDDVMDDLVGRCPMARSDKGHGYWVVNRHEDVRRCGQDWKTFSSADGYMVNRPEGSPIILPEESDPPYHNVWRSKLNPFLAPKAIGPYEADVRAFANELIDRFIERGSCDYQKEFAAHLPGMVLFHCVVPVPLADLPSLFEAIDKGTFGPVEERPGYFMKVYEHLDTFLKQRQEQEPRGDIIDVILEGVEKDGQPCPWEDKVSILLDVVFGGLATTTHVLSASVHHLATHHEDRRTLVAEPEHVSHAVEEFVRLFPPVVHVARTVQEDVEVAGVALKKGDWVTLNYASASRDPKAIDRPTELDVRREEVVHSAFGVGVHRCLGSHLARLELQVATEELLRRIPEFTLTEGSTPKYETGQLRTMTSVELTFPPGEREGTSTAVGDAVDTGYGS